MTVEYPVDVNDANVVAFIIADPFSVGLAAIRTANPGADAPLMAALSSTTGAGAGTEPASPMVAADVIDLVDGGEYGSLTTQQNGLFQTILSAGTVNIGEAPSQSKLTAIFASYPKSLASITAAFTRPSSPWERAFGIGQSPSQSVLDSARNSGSGNNF